MSVFRHLQSAFVGGEVDPLLDGRVDSEHYAFGLAKCENFVPVNEGPLVKRPGFEYIGEAGNQSSWLGTFRFSITQEYVIEWLDEAAHFYTNGGRVEVEPGVAYEAGTPYPREIVHELSFQQSYDRLYIAHAEHPPGALARTSAVTFEHEELDLLNGPFADPNGDEADDIIASGTLTKGGEATLTCDAEIFAAGHVGSLFMVEARDFADYKTWEPGMTGVVMEDWVRSDGKVYRAATSGTTGSRQPTHTDGKEWDGLDLNDVNANGPYGIQWQFLFDRYGVIRIDTFVSPTEVRGEVIRRIPDVLSSRESHRWRHSAISDEAGWPNLVALWKGRLIFVKQFDLIASVAGDYGGGRVNFETLDEGGELSPDLSFRRVLAESDPPLWIAPDDKLLLGTATRELAVGAANPQAAVSGTNIEADPQTFYGSENVAPLQRGVETIFVERGGRRLRASAYDFARDRHDAPDLTAGARHITKGGIRQLAHQRVPHELLWAVREDGQLVVHPLTREQLKGFARIVLGGGAECLSAVSIVGADGKSDELWLLVLRGGRREIWRQMEWRDLGADPKEGFFVDGGTRQVIPAGQNSFTGAVHLAGNEIAVLADGGVVPNITVAGDGSFEIPAEYVPQKRDWTLIFGHGYTAEAVTLRPERRTQKGTIQGLKQRVRKGLLRLAETLGIKIGSPQEAMPLSDLVLRHPGDAMDEPLDPVTGDRSADIESDVDEEGRLRFISDVPLPATILASISSMEVDDDDA